jgi:signal transduction histidine kinase
MPDESSYTPLELRALTEAGITLASELSLEAVLQKVVDVACELVGARYGALSVLGSSGKIERFITHGLSEEERARIGHLPVGRGLLGVIIREGTTIRMDDIGADGRSVGFPANHPPMRSLLGVPLVWAGRAIGNLYLTEKEGGHFSERDEELMKLLSTQAAVAIRNAELHAMLESYTRLEERDRIAMDLHDGVIQSIYAVGLQLEDVAERVEGTPRAHATIERAINSLNSVIKDIRSYIFDLRPSVSSVEDLPQAIGELAQGLKVNTLIEAEVNVEGELDGLLSDAQALGLYHIAQEALNNIGKHSQATRAWVRLDSDGRSVRLEVADNGRGLAAEGEQEHVGQGIRNIRDRARTLGATLSLDSKPGKGTTVRVVMPLGEKDGQENG